jgi:uncharacterized protein (TIGR03435 family)
MTSALASKLPTAVLLTLAGLLAAPVACAQPAHEGPAKAIERAKTVQPFDVVSIKENKTGAPGYIDSDDRGIFTAIDVPLEAIIDVAYDIKPDQLSGLTGPVSSARFDLTGKVLAPDSGTQAMLPDGNLHAMVVLLLEDRFHLKAHLEPRVKPVYDLVVAKGGLKIKLSQDDINFNNCGVSGGNANKALLGKNCSLADIASELSDGVGRKVIDRTGLTGHSDITLKWSDDVAAAAGGPNVDLFTALEEQLGLKLQPSKAPIDTLIIDHVEMPTQN